MRPGTSSAMSGDRLHTGWSAWLSHLWRLLPIISPLPLSPRPRPPGCRRICKSHGSHNVFRRRQNPGMGGFHSFGPLLQGGGRRPSHVGFFGRQMAGSDGLMVGWMGWVERWVDLSVLRAFSLLSPFSFLSSTLIRLAIKRENVYLRREGKILEVSSFVLSSYGSLYLASYKPRERRGEGEDSRLPFKFTGRPETKRDLTRNHLLRQGRRVEI